jgi:hypothetical protein
MALIPSGAGATAQTIATTGVDLLDSLLKEYDDLFVPPTGLPPERFQDHQIQLLPGTLLVAVRPYRYPQNQKDELEK